LNRVEQPDPASELEALRKENAGLNEQVKLLVRVEKRLYHTRNNLELQLRRIRALNDFALAAMRLSSPIEILGHAIELICPLFAVEAAVAVLYPGANAGPIALTWLIDGAVVTVAPPAPLAALPAIETNRSYLVTDPAAHQPLAPIVRWLDELARTIDGDARLYMSRDAVLTIGGDAPAARALLAFRSASLTNFLTVVGEADLPFLEVVARHVSRTLEMAVLHATLEQRVEERTLALRDSNEQLAESLARLQSAQQQLVEASRKAGMSEIATSVLHNVGNVLNSVNVSASLVEERVANLRAQSIAKLAELVREHRDDLPRFFAEDPRAGNLSRYLDVLAHAVDLDRGRMLDELASLRRNIDHIKAIIMLQQDFAKGPVGVTERLSLADLLEDALRFDRASYDRHLVTVERRFESLAPVVCDRHKILQIVTNLLSNARHAVAEQPPERRRVVVRIRKDGGGCAIEVEDTGCGIAPDNLSRVFSLGFTTRADGHGFGLHSSACSAVELGGTLTCHSDGPDRGALFRLTLPLAADAAG
jgi:C4-dicarboxylate-specific signal transduction histidine kinase